MKPSTEILQPSVEIRWFHSGPIPGTVSEWFRRQPSIKKEDLRTDTYLVLPGSKRVGVKLRQGRFEVKAERDPPREVTFKNDVAGYTDAWIKFSLEDTAVAALESAIIASGAPLFYIDKDRSLQRYSFDKGRPEPVESKEPLPNEGCLFELTALDYGKHKFWTLGFEAFGAVDRQSAYVFETAEHIFAAEDCPSPLRLEASFSYPVWLMSLPPVENVTNAAGY
ncbi:hypothetical protein [Mesorhizobium onobrychidis]|uniref:CYTH domain-containing protein n=1 Tax=Mesorhizobium onobrychidis TaxID=2775404 RepID=A0ABY5R7Y4_9HYPH|nr:hypothetical protein [Mesorhizobium onobrychidis]UVC19413.1 hypothetical protein IHQ72_35780 [Mesorhizobium onobrychidis]